jgi:hypothetical protein
MPRTFAAARRRRDRLEEDALPIAAPPMRRRLLIAGLGALVALGALAVLLAGGTTPATADNNPNNMLCKGHIGKGEPSPDDPSATVVKYVFACSQAITGYQVQPDHAVTSVETEVFATDHTTKAVVPTDSFSCFGDLPGYGVNCTGTYGGNWEVVAGSFSIDAKLCDEPRVDPLLTVTFGTANAQRQVTQFLAGPFDLGRPRGCPKSGRGGKTRIPQSAS